MKKYLFILLVFLSFTKVCNAQGPVRDYTIVDTVYSANAQELASDWISESFFLDYRGRYSTWLYPPFHTQSNPIALPALEENQKIIMQVKGLCMIRSPWGSWGISISTDERKYFKVIAGAGGMTMLSIWDQDVNLSEFANKEIIISFDMRPNDGYDDDRLSLDSICVIVTQPSDAVSLRTENSQPKELLLYPNPAIDMLYLNKAPSVFIDYIEVYDINGRLLFRQQGDSNTVNVAALSSGVYSLRAKNTKGDTYNQSFTKK